MRAARSECSTFCSNRSKRQRHWTTLTAFAKSLGLHIANGVLCLYETAVAEDLVATGEYTIEGKGIPCFPFLATPVRGEKPLLPSSRVSPMTLSEGVGCQGGLRRPYCRRRRRHLGPCLPRANDYRRVSGDSGKEGTRLRTSKDAKTVSEGN